MKKTTTPLHLFKNESKQSRQTKGTAYDYPATNDLLRSILSYAKSTEVITIMKQSTVLYWN